MPSKQLTKCPYCGAKDYDPDVTDHFAYDSIVDSISATDKRGLGFTVHCTCNACGKHFDVNFEIVSVEKAEAKK